MRVRIYKITNLINGKVYIGQTYRTLAKRWSEHRKPRSCCSYLRHAIEKYGPESFQLEQLASCVSKVNADFVEQLLIAEYRSTDAEHGYNLTLGGEGSQTRFCAKGHDKDSTGRTPQGACLICQRRSQARWKVENPDKVREHNRSRSVTRRKENPEQVRAEDKKFREANKERRNMYARNLYRKKKLKAAFQDFDMSVFTKVK